jgi:hypothetical protein
LDEQKLIMGYRKISADRQQRIQGMIIAYKMEEEEVKG